jgi:hypothetical protein
MDMSIDAQDIGPRRVVTSTTQRKIAATTGAVPREPLTWPVMLKMFIQSMRYWRKNGYKLVSKKEHARRYTICKECDFMPEYQCQQCGCLMFIKSKLAGMPCKAGKW